MVVSPGDEGSLLCNDCINEIDNRCLRHRYVCSVEGCDEPPNFIALVDGQNGALFLCARHFFEVEFILEMVCVVPEWLTGNEMIFPNAQGLMIQIELY